MTALARVRPQRQRILFITSWLPSPQPFGGAIRTWRIFSHLAARYDVTLLVYEGPASREQAAALSQLGVTTVLIPPPPNLTGSKRAVQARSLLGSRSYDAGRFYSTAMQRRIADVLGRASFDAVFVEQSQMAHFRFPAGPTLIVDEQNVEFELHRRLSRVEPGLVRKAFNWIEYVKLRREELRVWHRSDICLLTSEREAAIVRRMAPRVRAVVVPNGVDVEYFHSTSPPQPGAESIVFTGRMSYRPNTDAAVFFVREVLPLVLRVRPNAAAYLVGQDPPAEVQRLAGPRVVVTGMVDDVRPYLAGAAAVVAPVRAGSGTRIKILEALSMGKGVVSTSLGCEGLLVEGDRHLLMADDAAGFAEQVLRLLDDRELAARLGQHGRTLVERVYAWPAALRPLDDILRTLTEEPALVEAG